MVGHPTDVRQSIRHFDDLPRPAMRDLNFWKQYRERLLQAVVAFRCGRDLSRLMINLKAIDLVRRGRIGAPKFFNSSFAMTVRRNDIRTKKEMGGATLHDIGVYCINAARYLFRAEPKEVMVISVISVNATSCAVVNALIASITRRLVDIRKAVFMRCRL